MVKNDFSKGPVWKCILTQAAPLMLAQLVQLLYNVVDRYIWVIWAEKTVWR